MPQIAITLPRSWGGYMSSITAWESGPKAAPNTPWIRRNSTICSRLVAAPHSMEARVNPAIQVISKFFLPKRAASQPTGAVMMAAAIT